MTRSTNGGSFRRKLRSALVLLLAGGPTGVRGQLTNAISEECAVEKIPFYAYGHKNVYRVAVHATHGLETAYEETHQIFGEYLSATAGQRFDPPIEFEVVPHYFDGLFRAIEEKEADFFYANPGVYSCIGAQVGASALATATERLRARDQLYDLDVYGGVIAVRKDNEDIQTIDDLRNKVIGAGAIIDLMGGQMQIYEMEQAGMSYVNDPRQVVFTKDQVDVVRGVLSGRFDAGFVRTGQIELTTDEFGNFLDGDLFRIIDPKIFVMDNGQLFPFLHSTEVYPEWPFAALPNVAKDVANEVQRALMDFGLYAMVRERYEECRAAAAEEGSNNDGSVCDTLSARDLVPTAPCDATTDLVALAAEGANASHVSSFRPSRSYFELRSVQQEAGFLVTDDKGDWYCTRPSNLYEGISCPPGFFKRHEVEFLNGCDRLGLACDEKDDYDCFCKPCVKAYEVDIYEHHAGEEDPHLVEYYGEEYPACAKMTICATIHQRETAKIRVFDNEGRDDAVFTIINHAGDRDTHLPLTRIPGTYAYEFYVTDHLLQVQVIEVLIDGVPVSQSPIRVMVTEADCHGSHGLGSNRVANAEGYCVCGGNTYEVGSTCLESQYFFLIVFAGVFLIMMGFVMVYLSYKRKQNDAVWHVHADELHFSEPPEVIGQGGFGVVILGQYRGTKVAVKRVLPPAGRKGASKSASFEGTLRAKSVRALRPDRDLTGSGEKGDVRFAEDSNKANDGDIEAPLGASLSKVVDESPSTRYTTSSSENKALEDLIQQSHHSNNILRILESATVSANNSGSGILDPTMSGSGRSLSFFMPLWLRYDDQARMRKEFIHEMRMLSRLRHPCITTVMGAVITREVDPMLVMEYMEYGSLYDLLRNETMSAGGEIILQIVRDVVQGIQFLHTAKPPILHGDLKAKNILVDSRFRAKVADFGFSHFKTGGKKNVLQGTPLYLAPEYLKRRTEYTTACDVYSLGMIIYEIYARADPFEGEDLRKILPKVCHPRINLRPPVPKACPQKMAELMKKCWSTNPFFRPTAKDMDYLLVEMSPNDTEPLESLKDSIKENLKKDRPTSLYDVFPKHIADALNAGKKVEAESHEIVTVVFSDIVGFTTISETCTPLQIANMLDRLYHAFDALARKHNIFKVETIGDAYMGVTNLDGTEYETHVKQVALFARDIIGAASQINIDDDDPMRGTVRIRVGFHSGPVVSNVIGSLNPRYGLFGDTVNTASRMESNSKAGKIHCTNTSAKLLEAQAPEIELRTRGLIDVKGKGRMKTYWVGTIDEPADLPLLSGSMHSLGSQISNRSGSAIHMPNPTRRHSNSIMRMSQIMTSMKDVKNLVGGYDTNDDTNDEHSLPSMATEGDYHSKMNHVKRIVPESIVELEYSERTTAETAPNTVSDGSNSSDGHKYVPIEKSTQESRAPQQASKIDMDGSLGTIRKVEMSY